MRSGDLPAARRRPKDPLISGNSERNERFTAAPDELVRLGRESNQYDNVPTHYRGIEEINDPNQASHTEGNANGNQLTGDNPSKLSEMACQVSNQRIRLEAAVVECGESGGEIEKLQPKKSPAGLHYATQDWLFVAVHDFFR